MQRVWADHFAWPTWYVLRRKEMGVLWKLDDRGGFLELGMTGAHAEFGPFLHSVAPPSPGRQQYLLIEAHEAVRGLVERYEFRELTTIRTFRWDPREAHPTTRPIRPIGRVEYADLRDRFARRFTLKPSMPLSRHRRAGGLGHLGKSS